MTNSAPAFRYTSISEESFEARRENGTLPANSNWEVTTEHSAPTYAHTEDGEGCVWYDTAEEMKEDVG